MNDEFHPFCPPATLCKADVLVEPSMSASNQTSERSLYFPRVQILETGVVCVPLWPSGPAEFLPVPALTCWSRWACWSLVSAASFYRRRTTSAVLTGWRASPSLLAGPEAPEGPEDRCPPSSQHVLGALFHQGPPSGPWSTDQLHLPKENSWITGDRLASHQLITFFRQKILKIPYIKNLFVNFSFLFFFVHQRKEFYFKVECYYCSLTNSIDEEKMSNHFNARCELTWIPFLSFSTLLAVWSMGSGDPWNTWGSSSAGQLRGDPGCVNHEQQQCCPEVQPLAGLQTQSRKMWNHQPPQTWNIPKNDLPDHSIKERFRTCLQKNLCLTIVLMQSLFLRLSGAVMRSVCKEFCRSVALQTGSETNEGDLPTMLTSTSPTAP